MHGILYKRKGNQMMSAYEKITALFRREPDIWFSRDELARKLNLTKSTTCRVLKDISNTMSLQTRKEGRTIYYSLSETDAKQINSSMESLSSITPAESDALSYLLGCRYQFLDDEIVQSLSEKLAKAGVINSSRPITQLLPIATQHIEHTEWIETIKTAIEEQLALTITYKSHFKDEPYTATIWPISTYVRDGALYLYSWSPLKKKCYTNALSRIKELNIEYDMHFKLPEDFSIKSRLDDPFGIPLITKGISVSVWISKLQAQYELEKKWPENTSIHHNTDGSIVLDLNIKDDYAFMKWILSMGPEAEVLSPPDWRNWIKDTAVAIVSRYL